MLATKKVGKTLSLMSKLTVETINPAVVSAQYAVRGELVLRAGAIKAEMRDNADHKFPFKKLVECNIGNPQAVGQQPLTFSREVLSLIVNKALIDAPGADKLFAADSIARAKEYLAAIPSGVGAYSESQGFDIVRQQVADYITARDGGIPAAKKDIFLTDGASKGVGFLLSLVLRAGQPDGVLVPIPQYPLYSASLALQGAHLLGYELNEAEGWTMPISILEAQVAEARKNGVAPRALAVLNAGNPTGLVARPPCRADTHPTHTQVINPGNPTGNSLPYDNMVEVIKFCSREGLVLMADEVYQANIWESSLPFHSFKKVLKEMADAPPLQLVSFHSTSKGFLGECGLRGGNRPATHTACRVTTHTPRNYTVTGVSGPAPQATSSWSDSTRRCRHSCSSSSPSASAPTRWARSAPG